MYIPQLNGNQPEEKLAIDLYHNILKESDTVSLFVKNKAVNLENI
jgi:hypothetical protein